MNKVLRKAVFGAVVVMAVLFIGCKTAGGSTTTDAAADAVAAAAVASASNVDIRPNRSVIRDWSNRNIGMPPTPVWFPSLVLGNSGPVKQDFGINGTARVKHIVAQNRNRESARVQAGLLFAAKTANELKQYVVTGAGQELNDGELDIVEEIATATKITIMGNEPVADFWQLVETEDLTTHQKTQEYLYYIVYSMPDATWKALVRKYTNDIIGQLPNRAVQTKVAQAFSDIEAAATREREQTEAEFKAQIAAQEQKARADARLAEAKVNQQTAANVQAQATERAEIEASASAQRAALRSGKPEEVAAASTSSGDVDWISALGTAAKVVF
ncbi:hypothetical protein AGMMS49940_23500 [Spirochaetia bacterium]|nr:hypothetical protein AGMMS49940_23500 [Spirochaetia bacterium]